MSMIEPEDLAKMNEARDSETTIELDVELSEELQDFLKNNPVTKRTIACDLYEWENMINELSRKEVEYHNIKEAIFVNEQKIIKETDFNGLYGANNKDVRKAHLDKVLAEDYEKRQDLDFSIDYLKRRISFLKALVYTKKTILEVEE